MPLPKPQRGPAHALTELQHLVLVLAEREGWGVVVQAKDGSRLQLRRGSAQRAVTLILGGELSPAEFYE